MEIFYEQNQENIESIKNQISSFYKSLQDQNITFKMVHIPSASLSKYSDFNITKKKLTQTTFSDTQFEQQQKNLENDVEEINDHISLQNQIFKTHSVRWDRDLMKFSKKKRGKNGQNCKNCKSFSYSNLYDGVHANSFLKCKWFTFWVNSIEKSLNSHSDTDSDSEQGGSWDFKRFKTSDN